MVAIPLAVGLYFASKHRTSPYRDKDTYGIVYDTYTEDYLIIDKTLKLDNGEIITLHAYTRYYTDVGGIIVPDEWARNLKVGDTVWFHYGPLTETHAEIFPKNIIRDPSEEVKGVIRQQTMQVQKTL